MSYLSLPLVLTASTSLAGALLSSELTCMKVMVGTCFPVNQTVQPGLPPWTQSCNTEQAGVPPGLWGIHHVRSPAAESSCSPKR